MKIQPKIGVKQKKGAEFLKKKMCEYSSYYPIYYSFKTPLNDAQLCQI